MWQAMFNLNTQEPADECFTSYMRNLVSSSVAPSSFSSLAAVLILYVRCHIHEVTTDMVALMKEEGHRWDWMGRIIKRRKTKGTLSK